MSDLYVQQISFWFTNKTCVARSVPAHLVDDGVVDPYEDENQGDGGEALD